MRRHNATPLHPVPARQPPNAPAVGHLLSLPTQRGTFRWYRIRKSYDDHVALLALSEGQERLLTIAMDLQQVELGLAAFGETVAAIAALPWWRRQWRTAWPKR